MRYKIGWHPKSLRTFLHINILQFYPLSYRRPALRLKWSSSFLSLFSPWPWPPQAMPHLPLPPRLGLSDLTSVTSMALSAKAATLCTTTSGARSTTTAVNSAPVSTPLVAALSPGTPPGRGLAAQTRLRVTLVSGFSSLPNSWAPLAVSSLAGTGGTWSIYYGLRYKLTGYSLLATPLPMWSPMSPTICS